MLYICKDDIEFKTKQAEDKEHQKTKKLYFLKE